MATAIEILAQQIEGLRREIAAMKSPQLVRSSLDNGAMTITQTSNGSQQVTGAVGVQYDGTSGAVTLAGPTPPTPTPPTVSTAIGGIKVHWDGRYVDPQPGFSSPVVAPLDWSAVDVQVSNDPAFPGNTLQLTQASFVSAAGGDVFVAWPTSGDEVYVRLLVRSKPGKYSAPSLTTGPTPTGLVQLGDLGFNVAQYGGGSTIYFTVHPDQPSAPSWGFTAGDLWLEQTGTSSGLNGAPPVGTPLYQTWRWLGSQWALLQDQGISNSLATAIAAQTTANSKVTSFTQNSPPDWSGPANSAFWTDTSAAGGNVTKVWSGAAWIPYQLGNGAIQPNSLVASNVIATGTISAALLEAQMVLTNAVIAGDPKGSHTSMEGDGIHFWQAIPGAQGPHEVGRLGTTTSNFLGVVDSSGTQTATIAEDGTLSGTNLNIDNDPWFQGYPLLNMLTSCSNSGATNPLIDQGARHSAGSAYATNTGITSEVGLAEVPVYFSANRLYLLGYEIGGIRRDGTSPAEAHVRIRDGGTSSPTISSPIAMYRQHSEGILGYGVYWQHFGLAQLSTGLHRLLLTISNVDGSAGFGTIDLHNTGGFGGPTIFVLDLGPFQGYRGQLNDGSGGSPTPPQNYFTEIAPAGHWSYDGSGSLRTDTTDIVQGYDPSGASGDGKGGWNFTIPNIPSGQIDQVDLYIYSNWTYYNTGASALISLVSDAHTASPTTLKAAYNPGVTYPKPGPVTVTLPSSWYASMTGKTSIGVYLGPSGGTNENYYLRADGAKARLRIWYHQ
jgi:hypothetical protein